MTIVPTIRDVVSDPALFAGSFRDRESWTPWFAFNDALFGLPLDDDGLALYRACTGRQERPTERAVEAWLAVGRRGGKSRDVALIAAYLACFIDWSPYLSPGEVGHIVIVASDRRQCRTIKNYILAFINGSPLAASLIANDTADEIVLSNRIVIEVATCSYKTIRGRTIVAALCEEACFWSSEDGSNPASEVIRALRPAMATVPGAMLLVISSKYRKQGPMWEAFQRHFGKDGPILVWEAATRTMNPSVPQRFIDEAYAADPIAAASEYGTDWRNDIAGFIDRQTVEAVVARGRREMPPMRSAIYVGFADPAGGSGIDSFTLGIAHKSGDNVILDLLREIKPPFSPEAAVFEMAGILKSYGLHSVHADRFGGDWVVERFRAYGIALEHSERPKSALYVELLPLINSGKVELLDNDRLISQLCGLERRVSRAGKDSIDHGPGQHDDVANACAGAIVLAAENANSLEIWRRCVRP